jgi:adenylate kinase
MLITRSTNQIQVQLDLEIENTLRKLRKEARLNTMAVARQQTLKEIAAPNVENQPLCINIDNNVNFELKSGFIHLLPTLMVLQEKILILISRSSIWFALA